MCTIPDNHVTMTLKYADVQKQYEKNKDIKKENIEVLKEWLRKQPHLPAVTELELILALHSCFYSIERAKATIEHYFTIKTACPEFFGKMDPVEFHNILDTTAVIPLPKLTQEDYQIIYCKLINNDPNAFIFGPNVKYMDTVIKMRLLETGPVEGVVVIADMKGSSFAHVTKLHLLELKKCIYFLQEALINRLVGIHCINCPSFIDTLMGLIKPYMKIELLKLVHFHTDRLETLYEYVPQEFLPKDFGGSIDSIADLHGAAKKKIIDNADFIESEENRLVDESKRQEKSIDLDAVFGVEGSFRKLDID